MGNYVMAGDLMRLTTLLTTASRGRMLTSLSQCRPALLRFATTASGARIRPTLPGHGFERTLHDIAVGSQGLLAVPRAQDRARHEAAFTSGTIAPWSG
jgi:hypothetical protein